MQNYPIENVPNASDNKCTMCKAALCSTHRLLSFIIILIVFGFCILYSNQWKNYKTPIYRVLTNDTLIDISTTKNVKKFQHKLLIWIAAYDTLYKRDEYVIHHLIMARNICESSIPSSFVRLFIGTCSQHWNASNSFIKFKKNSSSRIVYIKDTQSSNDFMVIEHFKWSCVEFMIGYYQNDLKEALTFQHRKYFQQHIDEFDWFWYTEEDLLYTSRLYWNLVEDTSFTFDTLSSNQTDNLLKLYAHKAKKPTLSSFHRYFFLPTLIRFEKPNNYDNHSTAQTPNSFDLWRLPDLGLNSQPMIEALVFFNEQWWIQLTNSHSAYYLLPRTHLHVIIKDKNWLNEVNVHHRELISSFWLNAFGYIRVASLTKFEQYLVHHASNKYYNHVWNLPKASVITGTLGFEYKNGTFSPSNALNNAHLLEYTTNHSYDIASCFPLHFAPLPKQLHEAIPICSKLTSMNKTT